MKNKVLTIVVIILLILVLGAGGALGWMWYQNTHIFVEGKAYAISAQELDLREEDISFDHYNSLHEQLPNCNVLWLVPFRGERISSDSTVLAIDGLTEEDITLMGTYFPELKKVDASRCNDYPMLEQLKEQLPNLDVSYSVNLGKADILPDAQELTLAPEDYEFDTLMDNLVYLHELQALRLTTPALTLEQVNTLKEAYPDIAVSCTVEILGTEYDTETTELNLAALSSEEVADVRDKLGMLPELSFVELTDENGSSPLSKEDVKSLMETAPDCIFHYTFDFYGTTISTDAEEVRINSKNIGDQGEAEVRLALDLMTNCRRFILDRCGLSNDVLAQIREDYRDRTKVVWRVYFGDGSTLTDVDVIRCVYDLVDDNCHDLIYCEDVKYMDLGHDEWLDNIPFIAGMPNLEMVILSGAPVKDLTPFENCKKLKILEIANCLYLTDISPLAKCESLEMLNISFTHVEDLSPLDELNITNLIAKYFSNSSVPVEEQQRFQELHPDCWCEWAGEQPYGPGWRYDDNNNKLEWYQNICEVFGYPEPLNNAGWYLSK